MSLSKNLDRLVARGKYIGGNAPHIRWGQMLRTIASISEEQLRLEGLKQLIPLESLGRIRGGVVTRANAYFLVRELPFDQMPTRLRVTRADLKRVSVVVDGLDYISKIERQFLKPAIKGPESLESAFSIKRNDVRLFDVNESKAILGQQHANGALAYLRRGETVPFKTSDDDLKGGIPSQRSQVKNRKPFWYSLQGEQSHGTRIIFPEHIGARYVFTLVTKDDESVVIDKLYLFEPLNEDDASIIHLALNSIFTWYQTELRGRSQLGEGVLELKIPDYGGLLLVNPVKTSRKQKRSLLNLFAHVPNPGARPSLEELGSADRHNFDLAYLDTCGFQQPEHMLLRLERELRALAGERNERRLSVADAKVSRRKMTNVAASIDAYATRLATSLEPHPDPRSFVPDGAATETVTILAPVDGALDIGVELFNQGEVLAGDICIARAGSILAAQFVRGALLIQPDLGRVEVPLRPALETCVTRWLQESRSWQKTFKTAAEHSMLGIEDQRTRASIEQRVLKLLHAI